MIAERLRYYHQKVALGAGVQDASGGFSGSLGEGGGRLHTGDRVGVSKVKGSDQSG